MDKPMGKLMELADVSVHLALKKMADCPRFNEIFPITDITRADALIDQANNVAKAGVVSLRIEMREVEDFKAAFRQVVLDRIEPAIILEKGFDRFYIPVKEKHRQSKSELKPRDQFTIENNPNFDDIYARAKKQFELLKIDEGLISKEEFMKQVAMLFEALKQEHPQLFDTETGKPLTPVLPVITVPIEVDEGSNAGKTFKAKLAKFAINFSQRYIEETGNTCNKQIQKISYRIPELTAQRVLDASGVALFLPKLYHGYSLEGAKEHCSEIEEEGFELVDPLTGLTAVNQNLPRFINNSGLVYKLAFHHFHKSTNYFCMQVSDGDIEFNTVDSTKAKTNVTSGLLFRPTLKV